MSISYTLYLEDGRPSEAVLDEIARALAPGGAKTQGGVALPHLWVGAGLVRPPVDGYVQEDHGFAPRLCVSMRLDKEHLGPAQDEVLEVVRLLLRGSSGDAVLLREADALALRRRKGKVEVKDDALWAVPRRRREAESLAR